MENTKRAVAILMSTLFITSLLFVKLGQFSTAQEPANLTYLHGPSLAPIHLNGNITLKPIHMHLTGSDPLLFPGDPRLETPYGTLWHELYPQYCSTWNLSSWEDMQVSGQPGYGILSSNDQIDMTNPVTQKVEWFHVDRMTITILLSGPYDNYNFEPAQPTMAIELKMLAEWYDPYFVFNPAQFMYSLWHQVWQTYSPVYNLTSWIDNPLTPDGRLSFCDSIDLTDVNTGALTFWHIEDVATDLILRWKIMDPLETMWHEIYPDYCNWLELTSWEESTDDIYPGRLSPGDQIDTVRTLTQTDWDIFWSMGDVNRDGYINQTDVDLIMAQMGWVGPPGGIPEDINSDGTVNMKDLAIVGSNVGRDIWTYFGIGTISWFFVDRLTITINVTDMYGEWMKLELKTWALDEMFNWIKHPWGSAWHEVYPVYSNVFILTMWDPMNPSAPWHDNCNCVLDPCDYIMLMNPATQVEELYHIEDMTYDLILNKKITNPVSTTWLELNPDPTLSKWYEVTSWVDNTYQGFLSPSDNVTLTPLTGGQATEYHVKNVTVTLDLTSWDVQGERMFVEALVDFEHLYWPKINPTNYVWHEVWPILSNIYSMSEWVDTCNGVLSYCDNVTLWDATGLPTYWHVEDVNVDMIVETPLETPPPPPLYWKPSYPDYAPSGMPDFDERQGQTYIWQDQFGSWSHCAPTAVANSIWWLDSEFENGTIPPPVISDHFNLVTSYNPQIWDDHDPQNAPYLIEHLAYLMDTNGIRTGIAHSGTTVTDMQTGIAQYLSWTGVNPQGDVNGDGIVNNTDVNIVNAAMGSVPGSPTWNMAADIAPVTTGWPNRNNASNSVNMVDLALVTANLNKTGMFYERTIAAPTFQFIENEVERCEDVELTLGFWIYSGGEWYREGDPIGHVVTAAGVNSTTFKLAISDPILDAFENGNITQGYVPVPHLHLGPEPPYVTHNDAKYVSHDIYDVTWISPPLPPCPGGNWTLVGYPGAPPGFITVIENAVVTSPLGVHDVAVTNVTTSKDGCRPMPTVAGLYNGTFHVHVNATVLNRGSFTETFSVTLYANITSVDTLTVSSLAPGLQTIVNFIWNTSGWAYGNYSISAYAVPVAGETSIADNTFVNGIIKVVIPGDINGDGQANILDSIVIGNSFNARPADSNWNPNADIDCNDWINILDSIIIGNHFLETSPPTIY